MGSARDDAIIHMSNRWGAPTEEQINLIESISDRDKRGRAKVQRIYMMMRTDPTRARQLLQDEDIPPYLRQQAETMLEQNQYNRPGRRY